MKRPRITARKAPKETSRPIVPPSIATTPASVWPTCSTTLVSSDIFGAILESAIFDAERDPSIGAGANASAAAAKHASTMVSSAKEGRTQASARYPSAILLSRATRARAGGQAGGSGAPSRRAREAGMRCRAVAWPDAAPRVQRQRVMQQSCGGPGHHDAYVRAGAPRGWARLGRIAHSCCSEK